MDGVGEVDKKGNAKFTIKEEGGKFYIYEGGKKWPQHGGPYKTRQDAVEAAQYLMWG